MHITNIVKKILQNYDGENAGIKSKLYNILMNGSLGGTGRLLILPVDQGFEHSGARSFSTNPDSYDPDYHFKLAIDAGLSAYAAPFGMLAASSDKFAGQIPTILKLNNSNSLHPKSLQPDQAITSSVKDALHLGCSGIGLTIYPGSGKFLEMLEEAKEVTREAKSHGLLAVIWSYPRGESLTKEAEAAIDITAYAAHMAALIGAHIIKTKLPSSYIHQEEAKKIYESEKISVSSLEDRIKHIVQNCFNGKRLVVFSGGPAKSEADILAEITSIKNGGGTGSIIGRNSFQRPRDEAIRLLKNISNIYKAENN